MDADPFNKGFFGSFCNFSTILIPKLLTDKVLWNSDAVLMWLLISTLPCPYVIVNHYYSLLCTGNVLGFVHGRKWEWLLERWANRLGLCWETSEEGEMWRSSFIYNCYYWLPSSEHSEWGLRTCIAFLICLSNYFVFIRFCILNYGKLRWKRFLCCISAAFSNSSLILCMYGSAPAPVCAENLEAVHRSFPIALSSFVHLWSIVCVAASRADCISGEEQGLALVFRVIGGEPHS